MDLIESMAWAMTALWRYLTEPITEALDAAAVRLDRRRSLRRARKGRRPDADDTAWRRSAVSDDHFMAPAEIEAYIDTEFQRHPDAPARVCGNPHPAHAHRWCQEPPNHLWDTHQYDPEDPTWT